MARFFLLLLLPFSLMAFKAGDDGKPPKITKLKFGTITIDDTTYDKDMVYDKGEWRQRKKKPSKPYRAKYNHTPLTEFEAIPWDCDVLVIGIGMSSRLPVTKGFKKEAAKRGVKLIMMETPEAVKYFTKNFGPRMNAIFHITC